MLDVGRSFLSRRLFFSSILDGRGDGFSHTGRSLAAPFLPQARRAQAHPLGLLVRLPTSRAQLPQRTCRRAVPRSQASAAGGCLDSRTGSAPQGPGLDVCRAGPPVCPAHLQPQFPSELSRLYPASPLGHPGTSSPLAARWGALAPSRGGPCEGKGATSSQSLVGSGTPRAHAQGQARAAMLGQRWAGHRPPAAPLRSWAVEGGGGSAPLTFKVCCAQGVPPGLETPGWRWEGKPGSAPAGSRLWLAGPRPPWPWQDGVGVPLSPAHPAPLCLQDRDQLGVLHPILHQEEGGGELIAAGRR